MQTILSVLSILSVQVLRWSKASCLLPLRPVPSPVRKEISLHLRGWEISQKLVIPDKLDSIDFAPCEHARSASPLKIRISAFRLKSSENDNQPLHIAPSQAVNYILLEGPSCSQGGGMLKSCNRIYLISRLVMSLPLLFVDLSASLEGNSPLWERFSSHLPHPCTSISE